MLAAFYTFKFDLDSAWTFQPPELPVNPTREHHGKLSIIFGLFCVLRERTVLKLRVKTDGVTIQ